MHQLVGRIEDSLIVKDGPGYFLGYHGAFDNNFYDFNLRAVCPTLSFQDRAVAHVKINRSTPQYEIDKILKEKGASITVLRSPPYHLDLKPIKFLSNFLESKFREHNISYIF